MLIHTNLRRLDDWIRDDALISAAGQQQPTSTDVALNANGVVLRRNKDDFKARAGADGTVMVPYV